MTNKFMVAYAKIVVDKNGEVILAGVFFGGIGDTHTEAESIARECVNTIRGGTILPQIINLKGECQVMDAMYDATEKFEQVTKNMIDSDQIIGRARKKK